MKRIAILGSTGSIGTQTLEVVRENGDIEVLGLAAGSNITLLEEQIRQFHPRLAAVWSEEKARELRTRIADTDTKVVSGMDGLIEVSILKDTEILVTAIVGMIGIRPTIEAIKAGKDIALANKETLVTAGHIIMPLAAEKNVSILPVDSEHSALWQCLRDAPKNELSRVWLTASGGPFRDYGAEEMERVTPEAALNHPVWKMGPKITVDSATLMNKGIECIEAMQLFDLPAEKVGALIHPRSQVHGMVEFIDGTVKLLLSQADMRLPAAAAIAWPRRLPLAENGLPPIEPAGWELDFREIDEKLFPCFALAREAGRLGGAYPALLVGADESAVKHFLGHEISYRAIAEVISEVLGRYGGNPPKTLEEAVALVEEGEKMADKICRYRRNR